MAIYDFRVSAAGKQAWKTLWPYAFLIVIAFLIIPLIGISSQFGISVLKEALDVLMSESSLNSVLLVVLASCFALVFGVAGAWAVTFYAFPLKKWMDWMLILPLTVPPYAAAYVYKGIFDPFGTTHQLFGFHTDIANIPVLGIILGAVLFPYVYTPLRASLLLQGSSLVESARLVGLSSPSQLFRVILPLHRPAIVGGLLLVALETLNEYGAPAYFGIPTYTTEIIRHWDPVHLSSSVSHALVALVVVGMLLWAESNQRKKLHLSERGTKRPISLENIPLRKGGLLVCGIPLLLGFIIPVVQMIQWTSLLSAESFDADLWSIALYTFALAAGAGVLLLLTSIVLSYFNFCFRQSALGRLTFVANLGYAIPGAIIGIGILIPVAWLNQSFGILLTGTSGLLIAAYCMRYQTVAFNNLDASIRKIPVSLVEAARTLGSSRFRALRHVILPQTKRALFGGLLLVFIDITKELPLTMLFQRFNQETLAVKAYIMMDTDGAFYKASVPSLIIVGLGVASVFVFRFLDRTDS